MLLEFDIFYLPEEKVMLQESGVEVPFEDCEIKKMCFINIAYFVPRSDFPQYTMIGSGADEFTCNETYDQVKQKIEKALLLPNFN